MARRYNKEGEDHLEQQSNRQRTMEDIDGGLHPAVGGQSLGKKKKKMLTSLSLFEQTWTFRLVCVINVMV